MIEKRIDVVYTLAELSQHNDLISVNGIVYDVDRLVKHHPGGDIIYMLTGIDATLHYQTVHPWHNNKQYNWLQQYRCGILNCNNDDVTNMNNELVCDKLVLAESTNKLQQRHNKHIKSIDPELCENNNKNNHQNHHEVVNCWDNSNVKYDLNTPFAIELKQSVHNYFQSNNLSPDATYGWYLRAAGFISFYLCVEYSWICGPNIILALLSAVAMTLLGMNVPHEANHGSISYKYSIINNLLGWCMDIMGQSRYLWLQVHNYSHHIFVNETACDHDTTSGEPFISFDIIENMSIASTSNKWWWRLARNIPYGKLFMSIFFLQFYRILMICDYTAIINMYKYDDQQDINIHARARRIPRPNKWLMHWSRRWLSVAVHTAHIMWSYTPLLIMIYYNHTINNVIYTLLCWYVRDAGVSLGLSLNFLVSHNYENVDRTIYDSTNKPTQAIDWYKMSIESSSNYGDALEIMMTGGLCHQIEHHIFPKISSAHYCAIKPIVQQVCKKHGVRYTNFDNIFTNLQSMFRYLISIH